MSNPRLTPTSRADLLDELEADIYDVVVVGGGITGAGIAREATGRGLRTALVEADDFAAGTSGRSSKLIHGGLRYLASGEVDLVRKTVTERTAVHTMAPHLAEPCWMVVPARNRVTATKFRAGITTYERLGAVGDEDRHQLWRQDEIRTNEPHLRTDTYNFAVAYREYLTDDARLVLGVLRAAVQSGATVASRLKVTGLNDRNRQVNGVTAECSISGREVRVAANIVVNAAGPWVDEIARMEQNPPASLLHLSKGIHVVVPRERFSVNHLIICNTSDRRSIFAIPRGDVVYIGTTDTSYRGERPLWPEIDLDDVEYLLEPLPRYFDVEPLSPRDVVAAWAGVRPLLATEGKAPKELSRKDEVTVGRGQMISIAGGKLTGFRRMAEDVLKVVGEQLGKDLPEGPGTTPIPGGNPTVVDSGDQEALRLWRLYGSEAPEIRSLDSVRLVDDAPVVGGEVDWAVQVEAATTLVDVVYRRLRVAWFVPQHRWELATAIAERMAVLVGWSNEQLNAELASVHSHFEDELAFDSGVPGVPK
ncbi:MAG: glycerol-3-phosphate dehydrogenase/oxidase [Acidimicrobiaceae bacterium]|nr:glycerol-3-phosphate dehydrogenase/oxidase [Acidimicrobiaceae bacterium]MYC43676.1 glycerol-3-phosphate dehydrogenase/oxidase [Acidimicrobiaceae bacterium]MYH87823.1 glycerol-3-phosphate dehydrogenase/oxidase [Acidimicrobiaceae bacterium]